MRKRKKWEQEREIKAVIPLQDHAENMAKHNFHRQKFRAVGLKVHILMIQEMPAHPIIILIAAQ